MESSIVAKLDVFFGVLNVSGDGMGYGHTVIDRDVTYSRDAWQYHEDYLIDDDKRRGTNTHKI